MATDADSGLRDKSRRRALSVTGTAALALALVAGWVVVFFIGLVGALWRFREPHAPAPILTMHDQWTDLAVGALQVAVGAIAIGAVYLARRRTLPAVLPLRHGSAREAALTWCAAIGAASATVLVLSRLDILRFGFSIPASVESDWLAVVSALAVGLREEPILVALPVLLLVGRMPIWAIMGLSATLRGFLYLYFGGGGFLWAALWGAAAVWVYYRYRQLWVLIAIHGFVMNIQVFDRVIPSDNSATVLQWINILILFAALLWWITPRALDAFLPNTVAVRYNDRTVETTPMVTEVVLNPENLNPDRSRNEPPVKP
ncbi:CPBP family intramembrane metalloprotease [Rhodococcus sp. IEGM 1354]|uniref:CPBP family glutamic-type intramembrane protease n=1 Tax=Rhodococcus sp. IEGM 1354 TaxID=3047088 RepID=UPI0024B87174|nr:CPBP family glutamic-type intramembrane protease [Rhodococcus sp. IEGM 1354]MDI9931753.1 CPBP family intramembrane metalloprotease [Rhodococcus sp. IEGM 1354]